MSSANSPLPPLPLPSSFPSIFTDHTILDHDARRRVNGVNSNVGIFSSLSVTPEMGTLFADYARFVSKCIEQRRGSTLIRGIVDDMDELKQLVNDLWTIHDGYADSELEDSSAGDMLDEDED
ncbi:mtDNA inheritance, partitioning of the mitochondrial organelle [Marasmius crinis-equi]|uniref:MtDNA inheritance, partitioning of the mitochondrial organelle n=1 Tax=Marasmius crinis-equi TaxID=585013 RepID=A0ABR3F5L0_9AGAR